jgi:hypothetical protein
MHIILHSDDLGITSRITKQILDAWILRHLDGFSIIANGDAKNEIPKALKSYPDRHARIAVHFNLSEGHPSAKVDKIPLLVDASGQLKHSFFSLLLNVIFLRGLKRINFFDQIKIECVAQIAAVRRMCGDRTIAAIDGHNHIHMIPGVFTAVALSAQSEGIFGIRVSSEPFFIEKPWSDWLRMYWWINLIKHCLLNLFSISAFGIAKNLGLKTPNAIIGIQYTGNMTKERAIRGLKSSSRLNEVEVLFHIGRASEEEAALRWRNPTYAAFHLSNLRDIERVELYQMKESLLAQMPSTFNSSDNQSH